MVSNPGIRNDHQTLQWHSWLRNTWDLAFGSTHKKLNNNQRREWAELCVSVTVIIWHPGYAECPLNFSTPWELIFFFSPILSPLLGCRIGVLVPSWVAGRSEEGSAQLWCSPVLNTYWQDQQILTGKVAGCNTIGCSMEKHYICHSSWEKFGRTRWITQLSHSQWKCGINQRELDLNRDKTEATEFYLAWLISIPKANEWI